MPDKEKVIKEFEAFVNGNCPSDSKHVCHIELMETVLAMLKEQEAVEPKQIVRKQCKTEHSDGSVDYYAEWFCPHCNSLILRGFDNRSIKFCYKCGKPILWEGR